MPDEQEQVFLAIDRHFKTTGNSDFMGLLQKPIEGPYLWIPTENIEKVRMLVEEARKVDGLIPEGMDIAFSGPPQPWEDHQVYTIYLLPKSPRSRVRGSSSLRAKSTRAALRAAY